MQNNTFLIKNGVDNVLRLLQHSQDSKLKLQAAKSLQKIAQTKVSALSMKLKTAKSVQILLDQIESEQNQDNTELLFYCKMGLLELTNAIENQIEIEEKDGIKHLLSLALYKPKDLSEKLLFVKSIQ